MKLLHVLVTMSIGSGLLDRPGSPQPVGLGAIRCGRDLDRACAESRRTGKPVLVLFQEVPGCPTCVSFGQGPLSHPLLLQVIETEFVPVAIYNHRPGRHADIFRACPEPAWNNPVMRLMDARGWLSRRQRALADRIAAALSRRPGALDGLRRPDHAAALGACERELTARLAVAAP